MTNPTQELFAAVAARDLDRVRALLASGADPNRRGPRAPSPAEPRVKVIALPGTVDLEERFAGALENAPAEARAFYADLTGLLRVGSKDPAPCASESPETPEDAVGGELPLAAAILTGDIDLVGALIDAGASLAPEPIWDSTPPLVLAVEQGDARIVRRLLAAGAPVGRGFDTTALLEAARGGRTDLVHLLVAAGARVDQGDADGHTPLMAAAARGHVETVRELLAAGADPNVEAEGDTALLGAARGAQREVFELLVPLAPAGVGEQASEEYERAAARQAQAAAQDPRIEALVDAGMYGNVEEATKLLSAGVDPDGFSIRRGQTALMYAGAYGHMPVVEALLAAGADPDLGARPDGMDGEGRTALMMAASSFFAKDRERVIRRLIECGARLDVQDAEGHTALMVAVITGSGFTRSVETYWMPFCSPRRSSQSLRTAPMYSLGTWIETLKYGSSM